MSQHPCCKAKPTQQLLFYQLTRLESEYTVLMVICDVGATGEADRETEDLPGRKEADKDESKLISLCWCVLVSSASGQSRYQSITLQE